MARLTSDIFVSGLVRQINAAGGSAVIARKGSPEAGAIFISHWQLTDRKYVFYEPALVMGESVSPIGGRLFRQLEQRYAEDELAERIGREASFDPDFWVVEIEHCPLPMEVLVTLTKDG
ncbi:MAG: DUF1491 family protein [Pseudomonadota bacterium]